MNRHRCECSICTERGDEIERLQEAKRRALDLADVRAIEANGLRQVVDWVDTWVSNPVGSYSVAALDGLFAMTRDRIAALTDEQGEK
jgi:anti-sigma factor RsiW